MILHPRFNRVSAISADLKTVTLAATTMFQVLVLELYWQALHQQVFMLLVPQIFLNDAGLYAELQKKNVSDVSLAQSKLFIKSQVEKLHHLIL